MINRIVLVGRLTKDPELRTTTNGTSVTSFTVAVDNRVRAGTEKTTSFINCIAFGSTADNMAKYTRKGSLIGVDGRLQQRSYENKEGRRINLVEVVADTVKFLEPRGTVESSTASNDYQPDDNKDESKNLETMDIVDDDLPF